jgi:hypothetical protein
MSPTVSSIADSLRRAVEDTSKEVRDFEPY